MDYVSVQEFALLMGISKKTVYRLVKADAIPYYRIGKVIRLKVEDFREGIERWTKAEE